MKKIAKLLLILFVLMMLFSINSLESITHAEEADFNNFSFVTSKTRENGKIKVIIKLGWETIDEIAINSITTEINGLTQSTEKVNISVAEIETIDENGNKIVKYKYSADYVVEHWQIGTMNLYIKYFNLNDGEHYVKDYCIAGGEWLSEEIKWNKSLFYGLFVTGCVVLGTYIIIETSKKGYLNSDSEE